MEIFIRFVDYANSIWVINKIPLNWYTRFCGGYLDDAPKAQSPKKGMLQLPLNFFLFIIISNSNIDTSSIVLINSRFVISEKW